MWDVLLDIGAALSWSAMIGLAGALWHILTWSAIAELKLQRSWLTVCGFGASGRFFISLIDFG